MTLKGISMIMEYERFLLLFGIAFISLVFLPYIVWGESSYIIIFDNLDSSLVWAKIVLEEGGFFLSPTATVEQIMNGLPHASVYETYDISLVLFNLLGMFWGYVANKYLMALIAFFGMYYLLKTHIVKKDTPIYISFLVAVFFSLIPFWSFSASVAATPLAMFAFLNLRKNDIRIANWLILLLYAFYSSLVLTGVFLMLVVLSLFIWDLLKHKRFDKYILLGLTFLSTFYIISHLPLFISYLYQDGYVSHRIEFSYDGNGNKDTLKTLLYMFVAGDRQGSVPSLQLFMLPSILLIFLVMIKKKEYDKKYIALFGFIILSSIFYTLYDWHLLAGIKHSVSQYFPIDLGRFFWLHPMCWSLLFCMSLYYIGKWFNWGRYAIPAILVVQFFFVLSQQPYYTNRHLPTYKQFFAERQFNDIKSFIGERPDRYRVISIGMHPSISQYNGFYTLDGFSRNYPLSYKHQFRKIIEGEFKKDKGIENFFDKWGSWCYAFTAECGSFLEYDNSTKIEELDYNFDLFKEMGGRYILSVVEIEKKGNPRLRFLKKFDNYSDSNWTIYLYEVI